jgi:hypothetical protein
MAACHDPRIGVLNADEVCPDYWNTYAQTVFYIFTEMILTTDRICDMFLGYCTKPVYETLEIATYQQEVLADKPAEIANDDFQQKLYE